MKVLKTIDIAHLTARQRPIIFIQMQVSALAEGWIGPPQAARFLLSHEPDTETEAGARRATRGAAGRVQGGVCGCPEAGTSLIIPEAGLTDSLSLGLETQARLRTHTSCRKADEPSGAGVRRVGRGAAGGVRGGECSRDEGPTGPPRGG